MATFDENGNYVKTAWKGGDKITAAKLNKIEESLEAINNHDISRHEEADARLDALENKAEYDDQEIRAMIDTLEDTVVSNKDAADLEIYRIDAHMTLLDKKIDDGVAEVEAIANTVDGKIAEADANMKAQVESVIITTNKLNTFQNEVNTQLDGFQNTIDNHTHEEYLQLNGGKINGTLEAEKYSSTVTVSSADGGNTVGEIVSSEIFTDEYGQCRISALKEDDGVVMILNPSDKTMTINGDIKPPGGYSVNLGNETNRWRGIYLVNNPNVSSDRSLKENIEYVGKAKSGLAYADMYNFVKDDLGLATYNFIGQDKLQMNFIAQDLLVNSDGTDNKIGQMIVEPVAIPTEEEIENGAPYPTLSYDMGMYTSVLAGALKEAINKIEQLEARINELENK